ncbi:MAG: MarR family transcriptional regulator [Tissierellia bacterium]|nr:MarR family transcriptional regulator [Tissierellia bacterium]
MRPIIMEQVDELNQLEKGMVALYRQVAARIGVSDTEFWVLYGLFIQGGSCTQSEICDRWSLPKQTVSSAVSGLVHKGIIRLEPVPENRNRKYILWTQEGMDFCRERLDGIYSSQMRALSFMTDEERQSAIDILGKYLSHLRIELET